jgi:hypothetical protein
MITCHQIFCTIPWLSCEQLPYPSKPPRPTHAQHGNSPEYPYSKRPINRFSGTLVFYPQTPTFGILSFRRRLQQTNTWPQSNENSFQRQPQVPSLCLHPPQSNGDQLRRPCGSFHFRYFYPDSFGLCEFIQLVIFPSFSYSFDPPNLGTTQQIGYSNRSTALPMPRSNGQPRSNRFNQRGG